MSSGEIVPEVMTTLLKRSNTGLIAMAGSMQLTGHLSMWLQTRSLDMETYTKWNIGLGTVALSVSNGSRMRRNPTGPVVSLHAGRSQEVMDGRSGPFSYVETSVAKFATFCNDEYSSNRLSSRVRTRDCNRSAQNLFGEVSSGCYGCMKVFSISAEWSTYLSGLLSM
jgi:hypothetical protein